MVDMGISSNIMRSPSQMLYDILGPNRDLITKLYLIAVFNAITLFREVSIGYLQRASQQRTLTTPDTWSCPIWDLHLF